jgi:hypothetical protein
MAPVRACDLRKLLAIAVRVDGTGSTQLDFGHF